MFIFKDGDSFVIYYYPFHKEDGVKVKGAIAQNEEELRNYGFFIDEIPPMPEDGNRYELCADFNSKKLFYRIKGFIDEDKEDVLQQRIIKLENDITVLQNNSIEQKYNELMKGVK